MDFLPVMEQCVHSQALAQALRHNGGDEFSTYAEPDTSNQSLQEPHPDHLASLPVVVPTTAMAAR